MRKIIILLLFIVITPITKAQIKIEKYDFIREMTYDNIIHYSYDTILCDYKIDSSSRIDYRISLIYYNNNKYIDDNGEIKKIDCLEKHNGEVVLHNYKKYSTICTISLLGTFKHDKYYGNLCKNYKNVTFYRAVNTNFYYDEKFIEKLEKYKKSIRKLEKKL